MVHAIDLNVDNNISEDLKNLGKLQNRPTTGRTKGQSYRGHQPLWSEIQTENVLICRRDSTDT
jgi:hypothetical protein